MTWGLLGGPRDGEIGDGDVPEGYELVGSGRELGVVYAPELRRQDQVFRWYEDVAYIRDGRQIIETFQSGGYAVPAEYQELANATAGLGMEALSFGIGLIHDQPASAEAQSARDTIDLYRKNGLV